MQNDICDFLRNKAEGKWDFVLPCLSTAIIIEQKNNENIYFETLQKILSLNICNYIRCSSTIKVHNNFIKKSI